MLESVLGFLFGNMAAIALAVLFVYSRPVRAAYFPVILFFNTIPVLALAPIIILIFGLGLLPKIIIAAIICFFPTLVNMVRGLNLPTPNELELMHVLSATKAEVFWRLRVPRSLPLLFTSLQDRRHHLRDRRGRRRMDRLQPGAGRADHPVDLQLPVGPAVRGRVSRLVDGAGVLRHGRAGRTLVHPRATGLSFRASATPATTAQVPSSSTNGRKSIR